MPETPQDPSQILAHHLGDFDARDADAVIAAFQEAAEALLSNPARRGSCVTLPRQGRLVMTGDLHDHGLNLARILRYASLDERAEDHLILHEVIHSPNLVNQRDLSIRMLAQVARLVVRYPGRVHVLQSNHELAQYLGDGVTKSGVNLTEAFELGAEMIYPGRAEAVLDAAKVYIRSLLLAVKAPNGLLAAHSLPAPRKLKDFDPTILDRLPEEDELSSGGHAHLMVWGRRHDDALADALAEAWGVTTFLLGHQKAEMGYFTEGKRILVLASDHTHGYCLPVDLEQPASLDTYTMNLHPLNAVLL
ncbi:hypothetical protein [Mucisphaera sp.]|uniref:hypothetical protein n=1 Tax=Mucisphaera sp. TaxID=2913024 RepID=UPI003D0D4500